MHAAFAAPAWRKGPNLLDDSKAPIKKVNAVTIRAAIASPPAARVASAVCASFGRASPYLKVTQAQAARIATSCLAGWRYCPLPFLWLQFKADSLFQFIFHLLVGVTDLCECIEALHRIASL